jgi:hypothetical protein
MALSNPNYLLTPVGLSFYPLKFYNGDEILTHEPLGVHPNHNKDSLCIPFSDMAKNKVQIERLIFKRLLI